jgi:hypothetical protein
MKKNDNLPLLNNEIEDGNEFYEISIKIECKDEEYEVLKENIVKLCEDYNNENQIKSNFNDHIKEYNFKDAITKTLNKIVEKNTKFNYKEIQDNVIRVVKIEEKKGSLILLVTLVATSIYNGLTNYGSIRESIDYIRKDIKWLFQRLNWYKEIKVETTKIISPSYSGQLNSWGSLFKVNFLWSLSGASIKILNETYPDHNRYKNIGFSILLTGIFATLSSFCCLNYFLNSLILKVLISLIWGLTIINIDMFLVNSILKYQNFNYKIFFNYFLRFFLAAILAISISVPLELFIFNDEIRDEIDLYDRSKINTEISKELTSLTSEINATTNEIIKLENSKLDEMQGKKSASGDKGFGPIAKQIELDIDIKKASKNKLLQEKEIKINSIKSQLNKNIEINNKYGFLASIRSFDRLQYNSQDTSILIVSIFVKLILLLIELMPLLSKALVPRSSYDAKYEYEEYRIKRYYDKLRSLK